MGIVDDFKRRQQHLRLGRVKQALSSVTLAGNPLLGQRFLIACRVFLQRAQKNDNVAHPDRANRACVRDLHAVIQHLSDARGHEPRLHLPLFRALLVRVRLIEFDAVKLHLGGIRLRIRKPRAELFRLAITELERFSLHAERKHIVCRCKHLAPGAEIIRQQNLARLRVLRLFIGSIAFVFLQEDTGVRQPEAVNGLLHVADQEPVLSVFGHGLKDALLHLVGVLVLIDQNLAVLLGYFARRPA